MSGEVYSSGGGRVARFFVGMTEGWYGKGHSVEDVRDNFETIRNEEGYTVPGGPADEFAVMLKHFSK